jgi:hypothetical protein
VKNDSNCMDTPPFLPRSGGGTAEGERGGQPREEARDRGGDVVVPGAARGASQPKLK